MTKEHTIETLPSGTQRCTVCSKTFARGVWGDCPGVTQYLWDKWPDGLHTVKQIKAMGLLPGPVAGAIFYSKAPDGWLWLYRKDEATPKPPLSEKRQAALARMQAAALAARTCQRCGVVHGRKRDLSGGHCEKCQIVRWAENVLLSEFVVLDVETTGLDTSDEIISISVIAPDGQTLLNTYIKPQKPIIEERYSDDTDHYGEPRLTAFGVNGITNAMVADAPTFAEIRPRLMEITRGKTIIAYNVKFDRGMLKAHRKRYELSPLEPADWDCAMEAFAQFYGEYSRKYRDYSYQSLETACSYMGIDYAAPHEAANDCQATLRLLKALAAWKPRDTAADLREGLKQALEGDTHPIETLWDEFHKDKGA
jgi:DNA polymerase-3 subunit epsilon